MIGMKAGKEKGFQKPEVEPGGYPLDTQPHLGKGGPDAVQEFFCLKRL
jgi:hypothetical protein